MKNKRNLIECTQKVNPFAAAVLVICSFLTPTNAYAEVAFNKIRIKTSSMGWIEWTFPDEFDPEREERIYTYYIDLESPATILSSKAWVKRFDPNMDLHSRTWYEGVTGRPLKCHTYMVTPKRIFESYWNKTTYTIGACESKTLFEFHFNYTADSAEPITKFIFVARGPCDE